MNKRKASINALARRLPAIAALGVLTLASLLPSAARAEEIHFVDSVITVTNGTVSYDSEAGDLIIVFTDTTSGGFFSIAGAPRMGRYLLVGGGGGSGSKSISGGGGGGYTASHGNISISTGINYEIVVGAGGVRNATSGTNSAAGGAGGASSAFGESASGGLGGASYNSDTQSRSVKGGDGGSGGAGSSWNSAYNGGSDGGDGKANSTANKGVGQGTSTREFYGLDQDATATLYAGGGGNHANDKWGVGGAGGGGGNGTAGSNGTDNLGGGASGYGYNGGTGIVIIRNARSQQI